MSQAIVVPPAWSTLNTHLGLWHGCLRSDAIDIQANGIDLKHGRSNLDFGRGFYTTSSRTQAEEWSWIKYLALSPRQRVTDRPVILQFRVPIERFSSLQKLVFVRGDILHVAYWSFVYHCRQSITAVPRTHCFPNRVAPNDWYDVVCGPLATKWPPKGTEAIPNSDQFCFHTMTGIMILNDLIVAGHPNFEIVL